MPVGYWEFQEYGCLHSRVVIWRYRCHPAHETVQSLLLLYIYVEVIYLLYWNNPIVSKLESDGRNFVTKGLYDLLLFQTTAEVDKVKYVFYYKV